jgi:hypothetical protein
MTDIRHIIIDRAIPEHIREDYPMFEKFIHAYLEWLEQEKNGLDVITNLRDYRDIDYTLDEFVDYFMNDYANSFPQDIVGDKRLLLKFIKQFYKNKGNEASLKLLFRILYNEDIEFYYPKDDILRASDGKWEQLITLKVLQSEINDVNDLFDVRIVGNSTNSSGFVQSIFAYVDRGVPIYELNMTNTRGSFSLNETYSAGDITFNILEVLSLIRINNGGSGYGVGETIELIDNGNVIATGRIDSVSRGAVQSLNIIDGGFGYRGEQKIVDDFINLPLSFVWNGENFMERSLASTTTNEFDLLAQPLSFPIANEIIDDVGDIIIITDSPEIIGSGAAGIVTLVSGIGEILTVSLLAGGNNYNIPLASVQSQTGSGAIIEAIGGGGTIAAVSLDNFPIKLDDTNENVTVSIISSTGSNADLSPVWNGSLIKYRGDWINDDGFLSASKFLQDNDYYQDFSYDILSSIPKQKWDEIVNRLVHPAGFKKFGSLKHVISHELDNELVLSTNTVS